MIEIINLQTGETRWVDRDALLEYGMPEGFVTVESVETNDWITALQAAINKNGL
jgi:hypothetical protein